MTRVFLQAREHYKVGEAFIEEGVNVDELYFGLMHELLRIAYTFTTADVLPGEARLCNDARESALWAIGELHAYYDEYRAGERTSDSTVEEFAESFAQADPRYYSGE